MYFNEVSKHKNRNLKVKKKNYPPKNATYFNQYILYNLIAIIMDADITGKCLSQKYIPVK